MIGHKYAVKQLYSMDVVKISFSDGSTRLYSAIELGVEWFRMSNDLFYEKYGFNFNPHEIPGLYKKCRYIVHGE